MKVIKKVPLRAEIGAIYDAALDPARWQDFLELYARRYPGAGIYLWVEDMARSEVSVGFAHNTDPAFVTSYEEHYAATNPWTEVMLRRPTGSIHTGEMLVPRKQFVKSEFCGDWIRRQGLCETSFGCNILNTGNHGVFFSPVLTAGSEITAQDLAHLEILFPHMQRAVQIYFQIAEIRQRAATLEAMLNRLALGCVVLDARRRIAFSNLPADSIFAERDGLSATAGRLVAARPSDTAILEERIASTFKLAAGSDLSSNRVIALPRPSGKPAYVLYLLPLGLSRGEPFIELGFTLPAVAVFINDPSLEPRSLQQIIRQIYGLTPAETRLTEALVSGHNLKEAAESVGIMESTARSQLKSIFQKVDVNSQAHLMRRILVDVAGMPGPCSPFRPVDTS